MSRATRARRLAGLVGAMTLALSGCDPSGFSSEPPAGCSEAGAQCPLGDGPLGVCERTPCATGREGPCFECVSQH